MFTASFDSLSGQEKHDYILRKFLLCKQTEKLRRCKRDIDVIKEKHKFLWNEHDSAESWESRLAKKYYEKLFKEYCIADLSHYKENKIAMRWRTAEEVVSGKGQFLCGHRECARKEELRSWEVNFGYLEDGVKKNALVKLRLCTEHSNQLNYTSKKREVKRQKHVEVHKTKFRRIKHKRSECFKVMNSAPNGSSNESKLSTVVSETPCKARGSISEVEDADLTETGSIWMKQQEEIESASSTREAEFERYLEDLLM